MRLLGHLLLTWITGGIHLIVLLVRHLIKK